MGFLDSIKSTATEVAKKAGSVAANSSIGQAKLLAILNDSPLAEYGEATALRLDLAGRVITATVLLHGESEPVSVTASGYHLELEGDMLHIQLDKLEVDRLWAQRLIGNFIPELDFTYRIDEKLEEKRDMIEWAVGMLG